MNKSFKKRPHICVLAGLLLVGTSVSMSVFSQTRWQKATLPAAFSTSNFRSVVYTGAKFVAVGSRGAILSSPDGATWTAVADAGVVTTDTLSGIDGDLNLLVAVSGEGGIFSSADGEHWTLRDRPTGASLSAVSMGNVVTGSGAAMGFVAVGAGGAVYGTTSSDARIWYAYGPVGTHALRSIKSYGGGFVSCGDAGTLVKSSDLSTWATSSMPGTSEDLYGLDVIGSHFIAAGSNGTFLSIGTLPLEGISRPTSTSLPLTAIRFGRVPSEIFAVGVNGIILASENGGFSWDVQTSNTTEYLFGLASRDTRLVAVGNSGTILYGDILSDAIFNNGFD